MTDGKNGRSGQNLPGCERHVGARQPGAIGIRVKYLLGRLEVEENPAIAKSLQWLLERTKSYEDQFAAPVQTGFHLTQNNLALGDLEDARRILDAAKALPYRFEDGRESDEHHP